MGKQSSNITSGLKFNGYIVNKVYFDMNTKLSEDIDSWNFDFNIEHTVKSNKEKTKMSIELKVDIFKDTENPPFTMQVDIIGCFEVVGEENIEKYKANAIAIMYPYLRALVSTYTSVSNVMPVILPAINVNKLIEEQEKKKITKEKTNKEIKKD